MQVQLQFGLELPVGEKQAFRSNLLLNTSPEFEFMAYAVCALTGNVSSSRNPIPIILCKQLAIPAGPA